MTKTELVKLFPAFSPKGAFEHVGAVIRPYPVVQCGPDNKRLCIWGCNRSQGLVNSLVMAVAVLRLLRG